MTKIKVLVITFWGYGSALYLDCGGGYIITYICQKMQECTVKRVCFAVCKLLP